MESHCQMRRAERMLTGEEARAILSAAEVATVSLVAEDGPYAVPVSPVCLDGNLYFHCAKEGRKVSVIARDPRCWISAYADVVAAEDKFTTYYRSAMALGRLVEVTDDAEKIRALEALCRKFTPANMPQFDLSVRRSLARTAVYALPLDSISGKSKRRSTPHR